MKSRIWTATLMSALTLAAPLAEAKIYKSSTNTAVQNLPSATDLQLNGGGATSQSFKLASRTKVAITFSAECKSTGAGGLISIEIMVDGVPRAPTVGTDDIFCTTQDFWLTASTTIAVTLGAGNHSVKVRAENVNVANPPGTIDDLSLVIFD